METTAHDDMHAGELEVSVLLHVAPKMLREGSPLPITRHPPVRISRLSVWPATPSRGVLGSPSLATADKGAALLDSLVKSYAKHHSLIDG